MQSKCYPFVLSFLTVLAILFSFTVQSQTSNAYSDAGLPLPTVTSDKEDYVPGEIAHITGKGWVLDKGTQTVHVEFKEEPDYPDFHIYDVDVDDEGNWQMDYPIEERHRGVAFTVSVIGKLTGYQGTTWFTDGTITIVTTTKWSDLDDPDLPGIQLPSDNDAIVVKKGATLIIDHPNAICFSLQLGLNTGPLADRGNGTVAFDIGNHTLTVTGPITLGHDIRTGSINMNLGGTLRVMGAFAAPVLGGFAPGTGTVEYINTNEQTILDVPYNNLSLSNNGKILLTKNADKVINVGGNLTINKTGEVFYMTDGNGSATMNIFGNFSMTQGTMNMSSGSRPAIINLNGNFTHSGGTITETGTASGAFNFGGTSAQIFTSGGAVNNTINYTVNTGAFLQMASENTTVSGDGTFTLAIGATLGIRSNLGIAMSGNATGNIRTTTRNFSAGANYVYNGTAVQVTGTGLPTLISGSLTINNAAGVMLIANTTVQGTFALTNGVLTTNANTITASGTLTGGSSSSYVDGTLARLFSTTGPKSFPIGKAGNYRPLTLNYTALTGTSTVTVEQFESGYAGTFPTGHAQLGTRFWSVTESGSTSRIYSITLDGTGTTPSNTVKILKYNASPESNTLFNTTGTAPNYTANDLTTFSDFALGQVTCIAPSITSQPSSAEITYGDNTSFSVSASGTAPLAYQWEEFTTTWNPITNADEITLSLTKPAVSTSGRKYRVVITNSCGDIASDGNADLTVNPKSITGSFTADDKTYDGNTTATVTGYSVATKVGSDDVNISGGTATFSSAAAGTGKTVTLSGAALTGADKDNYSLTAVNTTTADINKRPVSITADAKSKYCGQADPALTYQLTSGSLVQGDGFSGALSRVSGENSLTAYAITQNSVTLGSNYDLTYIGANLSILSVSIDASASGNPVPSGSITTLYATVTPNVANVSVTFKLDGIVKGISLTNSDGIATLTVPNLLVNVYQVDASAGTGCATSLAYLPIYDPNAGFVTGGGWINSPAGAYVADPTATGKANFGFVAKYKKGSTALEGETEFQFQASNMKFKSTSYETATLVISNAKASYRGVGTINGTGKYKFTLTAIDGQATGGSGSDKIRMKIVDYASGIVVYDNQITDLDNASPSTVLGGGSIVIHEVKAAKPTTQVARTHEMEIASTVEFDLKAFPNPTTSQFSIKLASNNITDPITLRVSDLSGRVVHLIPGLTAGQTIQLGSEYKPGVYFIEIIQGSNRRQLKLLKQPN